MNRGNNGEEVQELDAISSVLGIRPQSTEASRAVLDAPSPFYLAPPARDARFSHRRHSSVSISSHNNGITAAHSGGGDKFARHGGGGGLGYQQQSYLVPTPTPSQIYPRQKTLQLLLGMDSKGK